MNRPYFHRFDNIDDRREILRLIGRLSVRTRLIWLQWCCQYAIPRDLQIRPGVAANHTGLAAECFLDLWRLCTQYELDIDRALRQLIRLNRSA